MSGRRGAIEYFSRSAQLKNMKHGVSRYVNRLVGLVEVFDALQDRGKVWEGKCYQKLSKNVVGSCG